ncbi:MAG: hypothetical protein FWD17_18370 [Polyangiaceae bacterium]|nr:hypothetical protein [Polyangiaceae bacterium]
MEAFDDDVFLTGRDPFAMALALSPILLGGVLASSGLPSAIALGASLVWLGLGIISYVWTRNPTGWRRTVRLRVDAEGVRIDGYFWAGRDAVTEACLTPIPGGSAVVRLRRRPSGRLSLVVPDAVRARELLRLLGGSLEARRALGGAGGEGPAVEWALARPFGEPGRFAPAAASLALVLVFGRFVGPSLPGALSLAVLALVVFFGALAIPTRVLVGADGVLLCWLGTARFIAWSRVVAIEAFAGGVAIALDRGEWVTVRTPAAHERYAPEATSACERMRAAWRASSACGGTEALAKRFSQRPSGGTRAWVLAAREVNTEGVGYRAPRIPDEQLWRLVENPRADRDARTGAAVALARGLDEEGRRRLRVAAEGCVEPRLRSALELMSTDAAATASEEALGHALDALEWENSCELLEQ